MIGRIVMSIGTEVVISVGTEFVKKIADGGVDADKAVITINFTDANRNSATEVYQVAEARALTIGSGLNGKVTASGNGSGHITVTIPAGTTAEIGFAPTSGEPASDDGAPPEQARQQAGSGSGEKAKAANFLRGTWRGQYRCGELRTVDLVIYILDDSRLEATFTSASENGKNRGISNKPGNYTASTMHLEAGYWVESAGSTYSPIELTASFDSDGVRTIEADINSPSCHGLRAKKVSDETHRAPL